MRPALEVADVFRRHGAAYRQAHAGHLGRVERRVMGAIEACRTAALGGHVEHCDDCGADRGAYNSCRNRHCPKCQGRRAPNGWRTARPNCCRCPTSTWSSPCRAPIAEIAFQNKAVVYDILFKAAARDPATIAADPSASGRRDRTGGRAPHLGPDPHHHPHVHCVVPGGGPSPDGARWISCRPGFFLPVRALSRLFRRLFIEGLHDAFESGALQLLRRARALADPPPSPALGRCARSTGSSTPSHPSAVPSRCSPISAATPTASPSPTAASSASTTAGRLPLEGLSPSRQAPRS